METSSAIDCAWSTIASTTAPPQLLYLDTLRASDFGKFYKRQSFDLLDVQTGHHVLDVGCGPGDDVRALAERTGISGRVVGVDSNEAMLWEACQRSAGYNFPTEFYRSDAHVLPFANETFDRCRADRVFQHLQESPLALQEMVRVAKSGANRRE